MGRRTGWSSRALKTGALCLCLCVCLCSAEPCLGQQAREANARPPDETTEDAAELRLGGEFLAGSVAYVHPLEPSLKMGGALGAGVARREAWGLERGWEVERVFEVLRAEWLVAYQAADHIWFDTGVSVALSIVNGPAAEHDPDAFVVAGSALAFLEPLVGWRHLRMGTRVGWGALLDLDSHQWNLVGVWGLLTVKLVIPI